MFVKCRNKCGTNMVEISKAMKIKSIRFKKRSIRLIWFMAFIRFIRQTQNSDFDIEVLAFQIATLIINWINLNSMLQLWGLQIVSFAKNFGISTPPTSFHAEIKDASLFFLSLNCRKLLSSGQSGTEGGLVSFPLPISHHHLFPDIKLKGKPVKIGRTTWSGGNPSRHPFDHADIEKSSEILTATYRVALSFWPRCHGNSSKSYKLVPCLLDWPAHFSAFPPTAATPPPPLPRNSSLESEVSGSGSIAVYRWPKTFLWTICMFSYTVFHDNRLVVVVVAVAGGCGCQWHLSNIWFSSLMPLVFLLFAFPYPTREPLYSLGQFYLLSRMSSFELQWHQNRTFNVKILVEEYHLSVYA